MTRSAYGYVYGNPLNMTDPSGLWSLDLPGGWCYGSDCVDNVISHEDAANFEGGVLDAVTLGNGETVLGVVGQGGRVDWGSGWTTAGRVVGGVSDAAALGEVGVAAAASADEWMWGAAFQRGMGILGGSATVASAGAVGLYVMHEVGRSISGECDPDQAWYDRLGGAGLGGLGSPTLNPAAPDLPFTWFFGL